MLYRIMNVFQWIGRYDRYANDFLPEPFQYIVSYLEHNLYNWKKARDAIQSGLFANKISITIHTFTRRNGEQFTNNSS